jgi:hypothetical protein
MSCAVKMYGGGGIEVESHDFFTSAVVGGE